MKKLLKVLMPVSVALFVLALMPAINVKAETYSRDDYSAIVVTMDGEVDADYAADQGGRYVFDDDVVCGFYSSVTFDSVTVDSSAKTVEFTNLQCGTELSYAKEGWTIIFDGDCSTRIVIEEGSATLSVTSGSTLTCSSVFAPDGSLTIADGTTYTPEDVDFSDYENTGAVFTNKAAEEQKEDTPAEEEKKEETPAEEPAKEETKEETTTPTELKILDGANQEVDGTGDVTIRANGEFANFDKLLMDEKEVDPSNYDKKEGSTIVTLKAAYVASLGAGAHTVSFVYKDGSTVKTTLTLKAAANSEAAPAATNTSTPAANPAPAAAATDSVAPKTGENIMWLYVILAMSALGMGVTAVNIKKNK